MNGKTCGKCNKTCNMENVLYCPFCGDAYKYCSINMCNCNENVIAFEKCTTCGLTPMEFTRQEFDKYSNSLDTEYTRAKTCADNLKKRIDTIYRRLNNIKCNKCTKGYICDSCDPCHSD